MRSFFLIMAAALLLIVGCKSKQEEQQPDAQAAASTPQTLPTGEVTYTAPEGWLAHPPTSQMRKAEFRWPGAEGNEDAELAVFFFPGTGGSVQANLNRWYGQFKQTDGSVTAERAHTEKVEANNLSITVTHVTGTYLKSQASMMPGGPAEEKPNYAMLAAIVETTNGPWFFKATGPEVTINHWRPSFDEFVKSLRVQ